MRSSSLLLLLWTLLAVCEFRGAEELRVCAFNLHNFGESKAKNSNVMHTLTKVRYAWLMRLLTVASTCIRQNEASHNDTTTLWNVVLETKVKFRILWKTTWCNSFCTPKFCIPPVGSLRAFFHCCQCSFSQIISRCHIILIQEVRDSKEKALPQLIDRINR